METHAQESTYTLRLATLASRVVSRLINGRDGGGYQKRLPLESPITCCWPMACGRGLSLFVCLFVVVVVFANGVHVSWSAVYPAICFSFLHRQRCWVVVNVEWLHCAVWRWAEIQGQAM